MGNCYQLTNTTDGEIKEENKKSKNSNFILKFYKKLSDRVFNMKRYKFGIKLELNKFEIELGS
jgi:hypothetical protein